MNHAETEILTGSELKKALDLSAGTNNRKAYGQLETFLHGKATPRICTLYGLRNTGKTALVMQTIAKMSADDFSKTAYILATDTDSFDSLSRDMKRLYAGGFRYVFIRNAESVCGFTDSASLFSDIYAAMGMKIVVSGDNSFAFRLAANDELYDRTHLIHTTPSSFGEYCEGNEKGTFEQYLSGGGICGEALKKQNVDAYIENAVVANVTQSLGKMDSHELSGCITVPLKNGLLPEMIREIIEEINREFVHFALTNAGLPCCNFAKTPWDEQQMRTKDELIRYLKELDFITELPVEYGHPKTDRARQFRFTQSAVQYCKALCTTAEADAVMEQMQKDRVLLDTANALGKRYRVFKLEFARGEFDMVIRDNETNSCAVYEIKHSSEIVSEQAKHLRDEEKLSLTADKYGEIVGRFVLYRGKNEDTADGIVYRNAEDYLKALPDIALSSELKEDQNEDENQGFQPTM